GGRGGTAGAPGRGSGRTRDTSPSSAGSAGATIATTPVGSGIVKLKYGPATGFAPPSTWASLSAQPADQTTRSIDRSPSASPEHTAARSAARVSIISATR